MAFITPNTSTTLDGFVNKFDLSSGIGNITLESSKIIEFHTTSFRSGRPVRYAKAGDPVSVVFENDSLVTVRLRVSSDFPIVASGWKIIEIRECASGGFVRTGDFLLEAEVPTGRFPFSRLIRLEAPTAGFLKWWCKEGDTGIPKGTTLGIISHLEFAFRLSLLDIFGDYNLTPDLYKSLRNLFLNGCLQIDAEQALRIFDSTENLSLMTRDKLIKLWTAGTKEHI